jgi:HAE1 family hydrophobic/amphiphilic exporter-1
VLATVPESERRTYGTFVGDSAENSDSWNESRMRIMLVSRSQRKRSAEEIRHKLAENIGEISGMSLQVRTMGSMSLGSVLSFGDGDVVVRLRGHDLALMTNLAQEVEKRIRDIPGVINIQLPRMNRRPEISAVINRHQASQLGVTIRDISQTLETTIRGTEATMYREGGDEFHVRVRLKERDRSRLRDVEQIAISTPQHKRIPLKNLLTFGREEAPVNITRAAQQRCVGVSMQVEGRDVGSVVDDIRERLRDFKPPEGYSWLIAGGWEQQQESFKMLQWGFILSIVLMYMVMAAQYESFRDPFLILLTVPLGAVGVICVMVFTNTTLNVQSFIGIIMLSGIVVNNAIVLIDYMNQLRVSNPELSLDERIIRGATRRFRPILMTTLTTILAMLPLAMSTAEGGEMEAPLARVVVGGLAFGKIVTLVAIPIVYRWAERMRKPQLPAGEAAQSA